MYTLYIYNNESLRLERYRLEAYQNMPYTCHGSMHVSDFFSGTVSTVGWTSAEFLCKWSELSMGKIYPQFVFRRIFEGGHIAESMHYAGLAADVRDIPKTLSFPFFENNHVALSPAGFPPVKLGDIGLFVLVLQDALATLGFREGELDGFFGHETLKALSRFCKSLNIPSSTECGRDTWQALTFLAAGYGLNENCKYINRSKIIL